jgi:hypothetical protein
MAEFGWAFISGAIGNTGVGPANTVQFIKTTDGSLTGSGNFTFNHSTNQVRLTGSMIISGTLQAHTFDVIQTNKIEISSSGGTNFGNNSTDTHIFTGSVAIVSGGFRQHYYALSATSYTVNAYDSIIGVSSTSAVSITLPAAQTAGAGKILIIKDETSSTRADSARIAVSGSGSQTIDNGATYSLSGDNPALSIYSNGVDKWFIY